MASEAIYPSQEIDPWKRAERCRAEVKYPKGARRRCGNTALIADGGLCWRHK